MELQNADQMLAAAQAVMALDKLDNDLQVKPKHYRNHAFEQSEYHLAKSIISGLCRQPIRRQEQKRNTS